MVLPIRYTLRGSTFAAVLALAPGRRRRPSSISCEASSSPVLIWKGSGLSSLAEETAREIDLGSQIPSLDMGIVNPWIIYASQACHPCKSGQKTYYAANDKKPHDYLRDLHEINGIRSWLVTYRDVLTQEVKSDVKVEDCANTDRAEEADI